jgi:hypothetical protein
MNKQKPTTKRCRKQSALCGFLYPILRQTVRKIGTAAAHGTHKGLSVIQDTNKKPATANADRKLFHAHVPVPAQYIFCANMDDVLDLVRACAAEGDGGGWPQHVKTLRAAVDVLTSAEIKRQAPTVRLARLGPAVLEVVTWVCDSAARFMGRVNPADAALYAVACAELWDCGPSPNTAPPQLLAVIEPMQRALVHHEYAECLALQCVKFLGRGTAKYANATLTTIVPYLVTIMDIHSLNADIFDACAACCRDLSCDVLDKCVLAPAMAPLWRGLQREGLKPWTSYWCVATFANLALDNVVRNAHWKMLLEPLPFVADQVGEHGKWQDDTNVERAFMGLLVNLLVEPNPAVGLEIRRLGLDWWVLKTYEKHCHDGHFVRRGALFFNGLWKTIDSGQVQQLRVLRAFRRHVIPPRRATDQTRLNMACACIRLLGMFDWAAQSAEMQHFLLHEVASPLFDMVTVYADDTQCVLGAAPLLTTLPGGAARFKSLCKALPDGKNGAL